MNQFILNIMKVYCIASVVYIIYALYLKYTKAETVNDILKDNEDLKDKYNQLKKNRTMVFIIGIVIGLCIIIITDSGSINISSAMISTKSIVEDVSDISVI
jgi:predicted histidine transporter YuiF (NhaC family)